MFISQSLRYRLEVYSFYPVIYRVAARRFAYQPFKMRFMIANRAFTTFGVTLFNFQEKLAVDKLRTNLLIVQQILL